MLLDYFFRGSIEITLPNSAVYSLTDPATGFTRITLLAKNTTPNGEEMTDGSIELVVKYRLALEDPFRNYPPDYPFQAAEEFSYIVVPEANNTRSIPRDAPVELTFDLSQNPIPLYAIDVYLQIVYNGKLGLEDGAVAVGFKDISEPTPIDLFNDADRICMNGSFYVSGSPEAIALVDTNKNGIAEEWPVYPYDVRDIYYRFSTTSNPQNASPTEYHFYVPYLAAGNFLRALFILSDYKLNHSFYATPVKKDPSDPWSYLPWGDLTYSIAIKNQTDYIEDSEICAPLSAPCYIWWYPTFLSYRDVEMWDGVGFMSICHAYPLNSECSCYEGILRGCIKKTEGIIETGDGVEQELIKGTHPTNEF